MLCSACPNGNLSGLDEYSSLSCRFVFDIMSSLLPRLTFLGRTGDCGEPTSRPGLAGASVESFDELLPSMSWYLLLKVFVTRRETAPAARRTIDDLRGGGEDGIVHEDRVQMCGLKSTAAAAMLNFLHSFRTP